MPRTGGVYNAPAGTKGVPNTTIQSAPYNALVDDLVLDANGARPITAGGTGATNATDARTNLGALAAADLLAAPTKAVPVDNDGVVITDSEDSGKIKRVLWSVIKDKLKAFFDGFYQQLLSTVNTIELNNALTANVDTFIDFHSSFPVTDYDLRIIRRAGVNGSAEISNVGTGGLKFSSGGGYYSFDQDIITTKNIQTNGGSVNIQAPIATDNAHTWYRHSDGNWRVVTYATPDDNYNISTKRGAKTYSFADGNFSLPGMIKVGPTATINVDGNVSGSVWSGWNAAYTDAFTAINARIEARMNNAISQIVPTMTGMRVDNLGSYCFCQNNAGLTLSENMGTGGSAINATSATIAGGSPRAGSWVCMGWAQSGEKTLFMRFS